MMLLEQQSPRHNLKLLWWLRNIAIAGQSLTVGFCERALHLTLPLAPLFCIVALLLVLNILTHFRLKMKAPVQHAEFFAQLVADMLGLAGLLYFTGGASNPFTSLFILQVVIAAIVLPGFYCWLSAFIAIALYTLLMTHKMDLPMLAHSHAGDVFSLHVQGMWVNFLLLALLIAWFVRRMAEALRRQDLLLAEADQLAMLGTFAAQAAHDLGTPLATMALIAEAWREEAQGEAQQRHAAVLTQQIARCKESISRIAASAGATRAESGRPEPLDAYLEAVCDRFLAGRPQAKMLRTVTGERPVPVIQADRGLEQALGNVFANAADASCEAIAFKACWTGSTLTLTVADSGPGIEESVRHSLGAPRVSTKQGGLGIGLYLAKSVVLRLGGTLEAQRPLAGGTCMRIVLPLARLLA